MGQESHLKNQKQLFFHDDELLLVRTKLDAHTVTQNKHLINLLGLYKLYSVKKGRKFAWLFRNFLPIYIYFFSHHFFFWAISHTLPWNPWWRYWGCPRPSDRLRWQCWPPAGTDWARQHPSDCRLKAKGQEAVVQHHTSYPTASNHIVPYHQLTPETFI